MRALTLRLESPQITINGIEFTPRLNDLELYGKVQALFGQLEHLLQGAQGKEIILEANRQALQLLEEALGEGAVRAISGGTAVSLPLMVEWLGALAQEAAEHAVAEALAEGDE